ncbi:MAG: ATP/GTP-binding protein [Halothiobacillaceae bacterium]|nr:ATP/GTP-binding protein [Halothiobacillaceae bacterium]
MAQHKIIFAGPVGAGKTTAIKSLSDIPVLTTDEEATDMTTKRKPQTTVAMDYGLLKLDGGERVHLYGTPGQERFDFMWDILTEGGLGLVLMLDNTRTNPFQDMSFYVNAFREFIEKTQLVIGVTRMDENPLPGLDRYRAHIETLGFMVPIFEVDAREKRDVSLLVQALLYSIDPGVKTNE